MVIKLDEAIIMKTIEVNVNNEIYEINLDKDNNILSITPYVDFLNKHLTEFFEYIDRNNFYENFN